MTRAAALRLGCVKYLNAAPLIAGWPGAVHFDHPSALCEQLAEGALDAALVSSFEYLRNPIYTIVNDLAIACEGDVYSVVVRYRGDLAAVKTIALDSASATSNNLLRCLIAERQMPIGLTTAEDADGRLLIGDHALALRQQCGDEWKFWDLGGAWYQATGRPFVFALWLVRPDVQEVEELAAALRDIRDRNVQRLGELAAQQQQVPPDFCVRYWTQHLRFHFGEREANGLEEFARQCADHGVLPNVPEKLVCA